MLDTPTTTAQTPFGTVDDTDIDRWELQASRRILGNLRTRLAGAPMLDLIHDQVEEADRVMKRYVEESHGEFRGTRIVMTIGGLSVQELLASIRAAMGGAASTDPQVREAALQHMFEAHPEHYAMPEGGAGVIETMGGLPTRSRPAFVAPQSAPAFVVDLIDPAYQVSTVGAATLDDGTVFTYVLQEYRDTPEGMEASLRIWYPAAAPQDYLDEHAQHYAVEFRNGARFAARSSSGQN